MKNQVLRINIFCPDHATLIRARTRHPVPGHVTYSVWGGLAPAARPSPADPSTIDPSLRHPNHILRGAAPRSCSSPTENTHTNHHRHTYMRKTPACTLQLSNQRGRQHSTTTTPAALCCAPLSPLHNLTLLCVQWVVRACSSRAPTPAPWAAAHLAAAHILSRMDKRV